MAETRNRRRTMAAHVAKADFRSIATGYTSDSLVLQGMADNFTQFDYGLGTAVDPTHTFTVTNLLLDERDVKDKTRAFRVETIPSIAPEPPTFVLAVMGVVGSLACVRRRRSV